MSEPGSGAVAKGEVFSVPILFAGSNGSPLRAVRPPNLQITPEPLAHLVGSGLGIDHTVELQDVRGRPFRHKSALAPGRR